MLGVNDEKLNSIKHDYFGTSDVYALGINCAVTDKVNFVEASNIPMYKQQRIKTLDDFNDEITFYNLINKPIEKLKVINSKREESLRNHKRDYELHKNKNSENYNNELLKDINLFEKEIFRFSYSMDNRNKNIVHPKYVKIIEQLTSIDAIILKKIYSLQGNILVCTPKITYMDENNQKRVYLNMLPLYVMNLDLGYDAFDISASLSNLENLGLISLSFVQFADNKLYEDILQKNAQIQGLEFDYVGVIIGKDLRYEGNRVITDYNQRAKTDKSLKGIKTTKSYKLADEIIRNTYRTLLSRGQKGCYIYCEDKSLAKYIKKMLGVE